MNFDPWTISLEDQMQLEMDDQMRCMIARSLTDERDEILSGTGFKVLDAVALCSRYELVMPSWLAGEFRRRFNAVKFHEASSWDDPKAFGRPYPKGTHIDRLKKDSRAGGPIYFLVRKLIGDDPTRAIDEALFDDVAAHFGNRPGLGRSECQRIYYETAKKEESISGPIAGKKRKIPVIRNRP